MTVKFSFPSSCDNAPKKKLLLDFNRAFAQAQVGKITTFMHDDIVWNMVGDKTLYGKDACTVALEKMKDHVVKEVQIHHVITHGKEASINGILIMKDGSQFEFCDVVVFSSASAQKITKLTSYVLQTG